MVFASNAKQQARFSVYTKHLTETIVLTMDQDFSKELQT